MMDENENLLYEIEISRKEEYVKNIDFESIDDEINNGDSKRLNY